MENIKDSIRVQAAKLRTNVEMSGFSALAFAEFEKKCSELVSDLPAFVTYLNDNRELSNAAHDKSLLEKLEITLGPDLVKVESRYLVSDSKQLISPAGFHTSDRVFLQPTIAIHVDDLKNFKVPAGVKLYAHDIDSMVAND